MVTENTRTAINQPPMTDAVLYPLDAEDDLSIEYPSSDGEPMAENKWQYVAMTDTTAALENRYILRQDVYVGGDMLMYYRMNDNATRVAPDVFVVFGASGKHFRDSWIVWREGKAPDFVMEVASPSTWRRDATEKRNIYANMGVTEYWRFDPTGDFFTPELVGERLVDGEYHPIPLETDSDGILRGRSDVLGLDICLLPDVGLRLYDPEAQEWLLTPMESEEARLAAEAELRAKADALQSSEAERQAAESGLRESETARQAAESGLRESETARQAAESGLRESEAERQALEAENERLREMLRSMQSGE